MTKLLMIALDGATLDLLKPWLADGHLPRLAALFDAGAGGVLRSTVPWATPTAFASFATGANPGKHGVYDFGRLIGRDYTAFVPTNGADVNGRTLWRILSDAGLSNAVINMPMTYPAEPINGVLVAGIPYPGQSPRICHPPDFVAQMRQRGWDLSRNASDDLGGSYQDYFHGLVELVRTRSAATAWLLREQSPDFVAVHYLETDQVQHRFWQFLPGEPGHEPGGPLTDAMLRLWQEIDAGVGQLLDAIDDDTTVCLMSDHGFGPTRHQVWLNNWLVQHGYLALRSTVGVRLKQWLYRIGLSPAAMREKAPERLKLAILQFFERQKGRALAAQLEEDASAAPRKGLLDRLTARLALDFYDVDWSRTRAFSTGTTAVGYVWLNLAGRDPQGTVQPGDQYEQVRAELRQALLGWDAVGAVQFREQVWHGPSLARAPDLVIRWAQPTTDARYFQTRFSSHHLIKPVPNDYASHRPEGMFLFVGPHVYEGMKLEADILDLTPTFLWLLEQPVPDNMDGRVLTECFDLERPVETVAVDETAVADANTLTDEEEAAIIESLRGLGYME